MKDTIFLKITNKNDFPEPQWVCIAHEKDKEFVNNDEIYFYVEDHINFENFKIGDFIELDEKFKIVDINYDWSV